MIEKNNFLYPLNKTIGEPNLPRFHTVDKLN